MSLFTDLYDAHLTIGGHAITWREILGNALRPGVGHRRHAAQGVGLAGRHRRQRAALHGVLLHRDLQRPRRQPAAAARPAGRCSSSSCRSTAGGAGRRTRPAASTHRRWRRAGRPAGNARPTSRSGAPRSASATWRSRRSPPASRPSGGSTWPTPGSSSGRSSRRTPWPAAGSTSGCAGSRSTSSACRCCCTRTSTRRRCCTAVYGAFVVWGFVTWLRIARTEGEPARRRRPATGRGAGMTDSAVSAWTPIERAIADVAAGRAVVVVDDEDRENEGDLVFAAAKATPALLGVHGAAHVGRRVRADGGPRAGPAEAAADDRTSTRTASARRTPCRSTPATASSTGISAADRARTIRVLVDSATEPYELTRPGPRVPAAGGRRRRAAPCRAHRGRRSTWPGWPA